MRLNTGRVLVWRNEIAVVHEKCAADSVLRRHLFLSSSMTDLLESD